MNTAEQSWKTKDGIDIYAAAWEPELTPRGLVCLVHGLGEHSGRFRSVAEKLTQHGYAVFAADLRGHGKSGGPRGHTPTFATLQDDLVLTVAQARGRFPRLPVFLYGQSMGGALVLEAALKRRPEVDGVVASSPVLRLHFVPPAWKVAIGRVTDLCLPSFSQASGLETAALSRDPEVEPRYLDDPLVHDRVSARLFFGFMDAGKWILEHAGELAVPVLLMHGSGDRLTSMEASCEFAASAGSLCTLKVWDDCYHELHNDLEKERVLDTVLSWLDGHL